MALSRRSFFRRTIGAMATAAIAPTLLQPTLVLHPFLTDNDVWCQRCNGCQLPDHISRDGMAWHAADGNVFQRVVETYDGRLLLAPWPGGPPTA